MMLEWVTRPVPVREFFVVLSRLQLPPGAAIITVGNFFLRRFGAARLVPLWELETSKIQH